MTLEFNRSFDRKIYTYLNQIFKLYLSMTKNELVDQLR